MVKIGDPSATAILAILGAVLALLDHIFLPWWLSPTPLKNDGLRQLG